MMMRIGGEEGNWMTVMLKFAVGYFRSRKSQPTIFPRIVNICSSIQNESNTERTVSVSIRVGCCNTCLSGRGKRRAERERG